MKARRRRRYVAVKVTLTKDECILLEHLAHNCDDSTADMQQLGTSAEIKLLRARRRALAGGPTR